MSNPEIIIGLAVCTMVIVLCLPSLVRGIFETRKFNKEFSELWGKREKGN